MMAHSFNQFNHQQESTPQHQQLVRFVGSVNQKHLLKARRYLFAAGKTAAEG